MNEKLLPRITILLSVSLFISSLTQTAYCTHTCKGAFTVLLAGVFGMLLEVGAITSFVLENINGNTDTINPAVGATFTWLANPLLIFSLFLFPFSNKSAFTISMLAALISLSFLAFDKIIDNEAGHYVNITTQGTGYWLWVLSSVTIIAGSLVAIKRTGRGYVQ